MVRKLLLLVITKGATGQPAFTNPNLNCAQTNRKLFHRVRLSQLNFRFGGKYLTTCKLRGKSLTLQHLDVKKYLFCNNKNMTQTMSIDSSDVVTSNTGEPFISVRS